MNRCTDWIRRKGVPTQLVLLNAIVFVGVRIAALAGWDIDSWVVLPSMASQFMCRPWTLVTYMVVHLHFFHLVFNMLWLYWFSEYFLTLGSSRQLISLYISGGVLGGAFYLAAGGFGWINGDLCGASASVLAVVVATAWRMPRFEMQLLLLGGVQLRWLAVAAVGLSLLTSFSGPNAGGGIAHLGGTVAGVAFALMHVHEGADVVKRHFKAMPLVKRRRESLSVDGGAIADRIELDALLDKVRHSGYTSLTSLERKKLLELSNRL